MFAKDERKQKPEESSPVPERPAGVAGAAKEQEGYRRVSSDQIASAHGRRSGVSTVVYRVSRANFDLAVAAFLFGLVAHVGFSLARFFSAAIAFADVVWLCAEIAVAGLAIVFYVHTRPGKIVEAFARWADAKAIRVSRSAAAKLVRKNLDFLLLGLALFLFLIFGYSLHGIFEEPRVSGLPVPSLPVSPSAQPSGAGDAPENRTPEHAAPLPESPEGRAAKEVADVILYFLASMLAVFWNFYTQARAWNPAREDLIRRGGKSLGEIDLYGRSVMQ